MPFGHSAALPCAGIYCESYRSRYRPGRRLNDNQLPAQLLSLGSKLDQKVVNPFFGYINTGALSSPTIPYNLLLRPYPEFGNVNLNSASPGGSSSFDALLVKVTKQFSNGLMLLSSYQWSKSIGNVAETEPGQTGTADIYRNYQNISIERSLSANDIPHDFVTTVLYDLPFGKGRRFGSSLPKYVDLAFGGWQTAGIVGLGTGFPVNMSAPSSLSQYGFAATTLPNITNGNDMKLANQTPQMWFNTAAFSVPAPYTTGTAPRRINQLREDGQHNADLAIMKNFVFRGEYPRSVPGRVFQSDKYAAIQLAEYDGRQHHIRTGYGHYERSTAEFAVRAEGAILTSS